MPDYRPFVPYCFLDLHQGNRPASYECAVFHTKLTARRLVKFDLKGLQCPKGGT